MQVVLMLLDAAPDMGWMSVVVICKADDASGEDNAVKVGRRGPHTFRELGLLWSEQGDEIVRAEELDLLAELTSFDILRGEGVDVEHAR